MRFISWGLAILSAVAVNCAVVVMARAEPAGRAASVVPSADFTRGTVVRTLTIDEALEQDDRIRTSQSGSIQVRFLDDTLLTIGPNSEILLDKFVFDGAKAKNLSIEVVRGAMRFVSGTSDHTAYEIKTPVATIGVRGTVVDTGFVNGHWIHNTIDGAITGCLRGTTTCRDFVAGQLAFSVGTTGFISVSPTETTQLFRNLDQTHVSLAQAAGQNPSGAGRGIGCHRHLNRRHGRDWHRRDRHGRNRRGHRNWFGKLHELRPAAAPATAALLDGGLSRRGHDADEIRVRPGVPELRELLSSHGGGRR